MINEIMIRGLVYGRYAPSVYTWAKSRINIDMKNRVKRIQVKSTIYQSFLENKCVVTE